MDDKDEQREFYQTLLSFQAKSLENSATYNQVIILAGYAAYFAVWSASAQSIPRSVMLLSGALILISVTVYLAWTITNMVMLKIQQEEMASALNQGILGHVERALEVEERGMHRRDKVMKWWKPVVAVAGGAALLAALLLAGSSIWLVIAPHETTTASSPSGSQLSMRPTTTPIEKAAPLAKAPPDQAPKRVAD